MEFCKLEILEIEKTVNDAEVAIRELGELELSLVGGGSGDVHFRLIHLNQLHQGETHMDFNKIEVLEIEKTVNDAEVAIRELGELELSLVGGGCGDVHSRLIHPQSTYPGETHMDFNKIEVLEIEKTVNDAEVAIRELGELELSLVGGGCGDVHFWLIPSSTYQGELTWISTKSKCWKSRRPSMTPKWPSANWASWNSRSSAAASATCIFG